MQPRLLVQLFDVATRLRVEIVCVDCVNMDGMHRYVKCREEE